MERKIYSYLLFIWSVLAMVFVLTVLLSGSVVHAEGRSVNFGNLIISSTSTSGTWATYSASGITGTISFYTPVIYDNPNGGNFYIETIAVSNEAFDGSAYDDRGFYYKFCGGRSDYYNPSWGVYYNDLTIDGINVFSVPDTGTYTTSYMLDCIV